ncbi:hypothetical protein ACFCZ2_09060 [Streptomyces sp. NPDC056202]|uniref:hypothetical protein n=1 Tax=Streptomyces sp. NPDC056202 TaxID=3345745 RepID=UPI0035D5D4A4
MTGRWGFISVNRADFGVQRICRALGLSRSGFYRWLAGAEAREVRRADGDALVAENREIHADHRGTYVKDMCALLSVSAVDSSSRPQWLAASGNLKGDGKAILQAGIPIVPEVVGGAEGGGVG